MPAARTLLIILARNPVQGDVKKRLARDTGSSEALRIYRLLLQHTAQVAEGCGYDYEVFYSSHIPEREPMFAGAKSVLLQKGNDLGERIGHAFETGFSQGYSHIVLIGSDCPDLDATHIKKAFAALEQNDAVLGPAQDGGFYLVGLNNSHPELFRDRTWSHEEVLKETIGRMDSQEIICSLLEPLQDIDTFDDLRQSRLWAPISIIIPTYNEESRIAAMLDRLLDITAGYAGIEIIVTDASTDSTADIAATRPVTVCHSVKGRSRQMNVGAARSSGEILYFLHADTIPPTSFVEEIMQALNQGSRAGCFRMQFDSPDPLLRIFSWFTRFPLPVCRGGDQSLFVTKSLFTSIGNYNDSMDIMEDYDLIARIERQTPVRILEGTLTTSARKYMQNGIIELQSHFALIHLLNSLGASQKKLVSYYEKHIKAGDAK